MNGFEDRGPSFAPGQGSGGMSDSEAKKSGPTISLTVAHLLRVFWHRRRLAACIVGAGILFSVVYSLALPKMYTSTTSLMPPDNNSGSGTNLLGLLASANSSAVGAAPSLLGMKTPGAVFIGVLESRTVQEGLVNRFGLVKYFKARTIEDAERGLSDATKVYEDPKSGIIHISVVAKTPLLASQLATGYEDELNRVVTQNSTSSARRERMFLEDRLRQIKDDLDQSSKELSQFSTQTRTMDVPNQAKAMVDTSLKLQEELAVARSDLAGLQQTYSPDNNRVRAAEARVGELQREINQLSGTANSSNASGEISGNLNYPPISALPGLASTSADLERRVKVDEALWEALTKQYEAAKVQEAKEIPTVRVLDEADIPPRRSSPMRTLIVIVGAMISTIIAWLVIFTSWVYERLDPQDERKLFVQEFFDSFLSLPGLRWLKARWLHWRHESS